MLFVIGLDIDSDAMGAAVILNKGQRKIISMGEEYTGDKLPLLNEAHDLIKQNYGETGLCCLFGVLNDDVLELLGYGSDDSDLMLDFLEGDYDYYIVDHLENYMKPADKKAWNSFKQNKPVSKQVDFIFYDKPRVIPENYLSPATCGIMTAAMLPVWGHAIKKIKLELPREKVPLIGVGAAFSFLAMMFNVPLVGGTTGHAVGGTLIALLFGPDAACIAVSVALLLQAVIFGDGGILAFGANCFNMAFVLPYVDGSVHFTFQTP